MRDLALGSLQGKSNLNWLGCHLMLLLTSWMQAQHRELLCPAAILYSTFPLLLRTSLGEQASSLPCVKCSTLQP